MAGKREETCVNVYDACLAFPMAKQCPMGSMIWCTKADLGALGIDHETAECAVESIRRWWRSYGKERYPDKKEVLIPADSGGSNGAKNRLWKKMLQQLANEEQLTIKVAHYPPGTVPLKQDRTPTLFFHFHQSAA